MALSLRERRRLETARDIQSATFRLARDRGFENVTTEAIADAAGISVRTFFNYYANKEAAALGIPPQFTEAAKDALVNGKDALATDLRRFLRAHLDRISADDHIVRELRVILRDSGKVRWMLDEHLSGLRSDLAACLVQRLPDGNARLAAVLADWGINIGNRTFESWLAGDPGVSIAATLDGLWADNVAVAGILTECTG
ncbi:TetR/AcrR family transcriptional regulator [Chachezhania sediminis]|uniref:TetR/AcrR family transcriptional regulator n=1 Tax=Chachezhania sediminis TaxID=2599291 RepID=UPI00131ECE9B|nr:TetR/AcrR family transcriptional regulator [Chachezhania sediminis]